MKKLLLSLSIIISAGLLQAQTWQYHWANQLANTSDLDESILVEVDSQDRVYAIGQYQGELIIGDLSLPAPEVSSSFVVQYEGDGSTNWAIEVSGVINQSAVDENDNLVIVGELSTNGSIAGESVGNDESEIFVAKISTAGNLMWAKTAAEDYLNDAFTAVHVAADGTIYVGGQEGGAGATTGFVFDGVAITGDEWIPVGQNDPLLAKLQSDGTVDWVRKIAGPGPQNIATGANGEIYASARRGQGADDSGVYLMRINPETAEVVWSRHAQHNNNDFNDRDLGLHVRADGTLVHFFKTGNDDPLDFGDGVAVGSDYNFFGLLYHVDADGQTISAHQLVDQFDVEGVLFNDLPISTNGFGVIDDNTFYIVGELQNTAQLTNGGTFNPDPWFFGNGAINGNDALVMKVDLELNILEAAYQTGSGLQSNRSVAVFSNGEAAVGGWHLNPEAPPGPFSDGTTIFGDTEFTDFGDSRNYHVLRVMTGEESGLSVTEQDEIATRIYPNPAADFCMVSTSINAGQAMLTFTDLSGKTVYEMNLPGNGEIQQEIDLSGLPNGCYLISLQTQNWIETKKLIVSR